MLIQRNKTQIEYADFSDEINMDYRPLQLLLAAAWILSRRLQRDWRTYDDLAAYLVAGWNKLKDASRCVDCRFFQTEIRFLVFGFPDSVVDRNLDSDLRLPTDV